MRQYKNRGLGYYKPISKEEAKTIKKAGISDDEYRYQQRQSWRILMGEPLESQKEFSEKLAAERERRKGK